MESAGTEPHAWAAALYDGCAAELLLYGRALGLGHAEAEDVLQDTFRALLSQDAPPREPRFYLIRAYRNRALNHRRSLWRRLTREVHSGSWFDPDSGSEESALERGAIEGLQSLPPDQREVIVLKIWHGLTFEAIAALLGISPNTAAGRYRYGLQKLRLGLQPRRHEHEPAVGPGNPSAWTAASPPLARG